MRTLSYCDLRLISGGSHDEPSFSQKAFTFGTYGTLLVFAGQSVIPHSDTFPLETLPFPAKFICALGVGALSALGAGFLEAVFLECTMDHED